MPLAARVSCAFVFYEAIDFFIGAWPDHFELLIDGGWNRAERSLTQSKGWEDSGDRPCRAGAEEWAGISMVG